MKKLLIVLFIILFPFIGLTQGHPDPSPLAIGASAPDFKLSGTDGKTYSLADFKASPLLVIIFSCNHCPTAQAYEDRVIQLVKDYTSKGVAFAVISPNDPKAINLGELGYTDMSDTYEEMKIRYSQKGYNFPYLYDGDTQASSLKYGPVATPHAFVFDASRKLQYSGRLDATEKPGTTHGEDVRAALDAMIDGKIVAVPVTKTFGCSIKWAWKNEYNAKLAAQWAALPVELKDLDLKSVDALVKNEGSGKLRLINIWATWCGPCVQEIPEFINIDRMYRERDFEFITISLDQPEKKSKALERLKKMEASNINYIFTGDDKYALIEKIDPKWQGALPYTLLVEPGGKIVYGKQGSINPQELKKIIVDNKLIGRYY